MTIGYHMRHLPPKIGNNASMLPVIPDKQAGILLEVLASPVDKKKIK